MNRGSYVAAVCGATILLSAVVAAEPLPERTLPAPSAEAIVRQFDNVVFGNEHGDVAQIVRKWKSLPEVAFFAAPGTVPPPLDTVAHHMQSIASVTGLAFPQAKLPGTAHLRVGFFPRRDFAQIPKSDGGDQAEYDRFVKTSACLGIASTSPASPGHFAVGAIMIGSDIDEALQGHCILEELVQITGLPSDACDYRPSLFCEDDYVTEMTSADKILLRTLYDSRLVPGMTREEAMPLVTHIVGEQLEGR